MEDRCVCCGQYVPEGHMVCWDCEHEIFFKEVIENDDAGNCKRIDETC